MLTDEQLEVISDALVPLFQYLEQEVIVDVAKRISESLSYSRTAELEAAKLQKLGFSPARIRREAMKILNATPEFRKNVAKNTLDHKREVKRLLKGILKSAQIAGREVMENAGELSRLDNLNLWKEGGKVITDHSYLPQLIEGINRQTAEELANLTQTTGFKNMLGFEKMENLYKRELDKAMIKICTGAFSKEKVVYDTVHALAKSGLRTIDFASGRSMQLDTAVKLAVRTGAHQLAGKMMDADIERTGVNLVQVSRHIVTRHFMVDGKRILFSTV
ncbi:MAG: phage minor capsid protein [Muribaculum sp.]|nr:phage minor capsid protein [Muribaculum sp.]